MTEQSAATANPSNKNDKKAKDPDLLGRFMAGNPGGPGNPEPSPVTGRVSLRKLTRPVTGLGSPN
jgi:hypothetical protein